jgi:hypothetical protein
MQQPIYKGEAMLLRWSDNSTNGRTVTFTIEDGPDATKEHPFKGLSTGKGGQRFAIVAVPLGEAEHPNFEQPKAERAKQSWDSMSRAQQAGILCNDDGFQSWLGVRPQAGADEIVADYVRARCGVDSRAKLNTDEKAAAKWDALVSKYRTATGQVAEQR